MSLEPPRVSRPTSPLSSGRSSPANRRQQPLEQALFKTDRSFRRYAALVERALSLFDTAQQEWADYIAFLGRLLKAIQAHPSDFGVIPHASTVSVRLAQCLAPSLPSGVHQKALEVYSYIFSILRQNVFSRDLRLYFSGLAPVLSFASLSVRPAFLSLLEKHILKLDSAALRPALKSIILCVLPGLEEETSEDFDRVLSIINEVKQTFDRGCREEPQASNADSGYFWQCLFLASITSPPRRLGVLAFLVKNLPKLRPSSSAESRKPSISDVDMTLTQAAEAVVTPEPGLLIRCFASGLSDSQVLIQRGFLDLLVTHLPLNSPVLCKRAGQEDVEMLVSAAVGVVLRRDMSLNRRLWSWLLGPESTADASLDPQSDEANVPTSASVSHHADYFNQFGFNPLCQSVLGMIKEQSTVSGVVARPFRITLSLMDRWEVGGMLVPEIFVPALRSLWEYSERCSTGSLDEVLRSASNFFDGVESGLIWGRILALLASALNDRPRSPPEGSKDLDLVKFIITNFNIREEEMLIHHIPLVTLAILIMIHERMLRPAQHDRADERVKHMSLDVVLSLTNAIPARSFLHPQPDSGDESTKTAGRRGILESIRRFYLEHHGVVDDSNLPLPSQHMFELIMRESSALYALVFRTGEADRAVESCTKILSSLIHRAPMSLSWNWNPLLERFQQCLSSNLSEQHQLSFGLVVSIATILTSLSASSWSQDLMDAPNFGEIIRLLVHALWIHLSPENPKYHVEAVRLLWQLEALTLSDRLVEAAVSSLMTYQKISPSTPYHTGASDYARRFSVLWTLSVQHQSTVFDKGGRDATRLIAAHRFSHEMTARGADHRFALTRPLLLQLEALLPEDTEVSIFVRDWLRGLSSFGLVMEMLLTLFQSTKTWQLMHGRPAEASVNQVASGGSSDSREALYYLQHILTILQNASELIWAALASSSTLQNEDKGEENSEASAQARIASACLDVILFQGASEGHQHDEEILSLRRSATSILHLVLVNPFSSPLRQLNLEHALLESLTASLYCSDSSLQITLLETVLAALRLRLQVVPSPAPSDPSQRKPTRSILASPPLLEGKEPTQPENLHRSPTAEIIGCIKKGLTSPTSRLVLENWVHFLVEVLPLLSEAIFEHLIPLVECLCSQLSRTLETLKVVFKEATAEPTKVPEQTLISLMGGLEHVLARAHDLLITEESRSVTAKSPDQPQGFFGNMVSGVFASEVHQSRNAAANTRLTVLLCFQDSVRVCFSIWSWGGYRGDRRDGQDPASQASFSFTSVRMRNRAKRILEHLFAAEALECLEILVVLWRQSSRDSLEAASVLNLLHVMNGSRPKITMPVIFNALYGRTNHDSSTTTSTSGLTVDLGETDLATFLVEYTRSVDDDAMDEIWDDCMAFLRDVLANPLPNRQILPSLIAFTAVLTEKVDKTNFGDQRKMRREIGDVFLRLLTATFTTRPMGSSQDPVGRADNTESGVRRPITIVNVLVEIVPKLQSLLGENDRLAAAISSIWVGVASPVLRAKSFPTNIDNDFLKLICQLTRSGNVSKVWRKDITEALNDPKFFSTSVELVESNWLPVIRQWAMSDKNCIAELLSRISAPATAGLVFGVGASSARLEADRKTQLILRRVALVLVSAPEDTFVSSLGDIVQKLSELITATTTSSPSSVTRAELFLLLRALVLSLSPTHMASLWPVVNSELQSALPSVLPESENYDRYNSASIIQVCKLLDTLLTLGPDEFQLNQWLFVTDTIDAVYRPENWEPFALVDELAEQLGADEIADNTNFAMTASTGPHSGHGQKRKPMLDSHLDDDAHTMAKDELVRLHLRPFLGQLSMTTFEATYAMNKADRDACRHGLLRDLFNEGSFVRM